MLLRALPVLLLAAALSCDDKPPSTAPTPTPAPTPAPSGGSYRLVWSDEFDRDGAPDPARWTYDVGGHGWGNNELQFYTDDRRENARVEGGHLLIEARREAWEGRSYTSARLITKGKGDWTYGRIEVRAKLPAGRGSWPAIWTLGSKTPLRWPDDGEIDIMEHVGFDPGVVHASIHTLRYNHVQDTQRTAQTAVPDAWTASTPTSPTGPPIASRPRSTGASISTSPASRRTGAPAWPFDAPQHLLLNVAVGGNWGGQRGVDDATLPYRLRVDYVRVYQR